LEHFSRYQFDPRLKRREYPAPASPGAPDERTIEGMLKEELTKAGNILRPTGPYADAELLQSMGIDISGHDPVLVGTLLGKFGIDFGPAVVGKDGSVIYSNPDGEYDFSPEEEYYDDGFEGEE